MVVLYVVLLVVPCGWYNSHTGCEMYLYQRSQVCNGRCRKLVRMTYATILDTAFVGRMMAGIDRMDAQALVQLIKVVVTSDCKTFDDAVVAVVVVLVVNVVNLVDRTVYYGKNLS